uniref:hypothetical protein n=1 Tax=uncultured Draconibacterium sp. TaxID=1573823 RepID=UPI0032180104
MKYQLLKLLVFVFIFSSCCNEDSIETARYELSPEELELIPYQIGQQISFKHSKGYTFSFETIQDKVEWKEFHDFCERNCGGQDYFSYQVKNTQIQSSYPKLTVDFSLGETEHGDYNPMVLNININRRHFISLPYDSLGNISCDETTNTIYHDSIVLNNVYYYDVLEKPFDSHYFIQDTSILIPESILYNDYGLIQIKMSNNEAYSINN